MAELTPVQRQALKARAHAPQPLVLIGERGLTPQVLEEIDRALAARELIKVRAGALDRAERARALADICAHAGAQPVQQIGKILVIYREKPRAAEPEKPRATRNGRRESRSASSRPGSARPPRRPRTSRSARGRSGS